MHLSGSLFRYTRRGVAYFERLRISVPGYDKVLRASANELVEVLSEPFGVIPNGIPHAMNFASSPSVAVLTGTPIRHPTISVEMVDHYGARVVTPPLVTLAPYIGSNARVPLASFCDALCQAYTYTARLRHEPSAAPDNPHLRGNANSLLALAGSTAPFVNGLATFDALTITLGPREYSTRVRLHSEFITQRQWTNGTSTYTETYHALRATTSSPFAVMRHEDPFAVRICQFPVSSARSPVENTAGACTPYDPGSVVAGTEFRGPLVTFLNLNGTEVNWRPNQFGMTPIVGSIVVRIALLDSLTNASLPSTTMVGVTTLGSAPVTSADASAPSGFVSRHVVDLGSPSIPRYFIQRIGLYRFLITSFGLRSATSDPYQIIAGVPQRLSLDSVPAAPQPYGMQLSSVGVTNGSRVLSVSLRDMLANHNNASGVSITLEIQGEARFLQNGWLRSSLTRPTIEGVADFSFVTLERPVAFETPEVRQLLQAIAIDGVGPAQGGYGIDYESLSQTTDTALIEFKGIPATGEIVIMPSASFAASRCQLATNEIFIEGNYRHPSAFIVRERFKYKFAVTVTQTADGPIGTSTLMGPIALTGPQQRQRLRESWPMPTPIEPDVYTICYRPSSATTPVFEPQFGQTKFVVGEPAMLQVVQISPTVVFAQISAEVRLSFGPTQMGSHPPRMQVLTTAPSPHRYA